MHIRPFVKGTGRSRSVASFARRDDFQDFHFKDELSARWNHFARAPLAVAQLGGNVEHAFAALFHAGNALVPALDNIAFTDEDGKRLSAVEAAVELLTIRQLAGVVHE